jgi:hypothetical protein
MAAWIRFAAAASAFGYFLRKHVDEEALGFAADITRKLPALPHSSELSRDR